MEAFEFINSVRRDSEEELHHDAISGEVMIKALLEAARKVEMKTLKKHGAHTKAPIEECWESTRKAQAREQVGGEGDQEGQAGGSVRSNAIFGGEEDAALTLGKYARAVI